MKLNRRIGAVAALSALLLASGCGGGDAKTDKAAAAKSASASAAAAFAKKPGQEIADASKADMQGLKAVHYSGSISADSGDISLDIQAKSDGDCSGKVGLQGGNATVLSAGGTSWFKGDLGFWKAAVGAQAQQIVDAIGDKWVLDSDNNFKQFCDLDEFFSGLFSATSGSTYTTKSTDTVDGQDVVLVERSDATDGPSTGYVLTGAKHYLIKIERTGSTGDGALTFDAFDKDFAVTAPAATDVVDPSTLQPGQ